MLQAIPYKLLCLFLLSFFIQIPSGYAESITPPVEKTNPVEKKKKKRSKARKKRFAKKHKPNSLNKTNTSAGYVVLLIAFFALLASGIFLFVFGAASILMLIIGLCLMAAAYLIPWLILMEALLTGRDSEDFVGAAAPMGIALFFFELIGGIAFIIWGLSISLPIIWITGIVLLALILLLIPYWILIFSNMH